MMSANFFNSDYIFYKEMIKVLKRSQNGKGKKQVIIPILAKDFDYKVMATQISSQGFDADNYNEFISATTKGINVADTEMSILESNNYYMKLFGTYLFQPYYIDEKKGTGQLKPIESWEENKRNTAFKQIAEVVRLQVEKL